MFNAFDGILSQIAHTCPVKKRTGPDTLVQAKKGLISPHLSGGI